MSHDTSAGSVRVILYALAVNIGIALAKLAGALVSGSASLFAESIHSAVDCMNQVLLLVGGRKAARPPDARHPLGYGREAFFWSFLVAIALLTMGGAYSLFEGIRKLLAHEGKLEHPALGMGILAFGFVMEAFSFRACLREIRTQNRHGSLWNWFRRTTSSDLLVIFTEDLAALLGLALAGACLGLAWITGNAAFDDAGSVAVGLLLLVVASFLATEVKSLLIGETAETDFRTALDGFLALELPGSYVLNLIALQLGPRSVMLSCKLHPGPTESVKRLIDGINAVERAMKAEFPEIRWQFFEPDFYD
jgi:cation diffusion facilitator family transporter